MKGLNSKWGGMGLGLMVVAVGCLAFVGCPAFADKGLSALEAALAGRPYVNTLKLATALTNTETVTIGGQVYQFDNTTNTPGKMTNGNYRVDSQTQGLSVSNSVIALAASINLNSSRGILASVIGTNKVFIETRPGAVPTAWACAKSVSGSGNAWFASAMVGGGAAYKGVQVQSRAVIAAEVTDGVVRFVFPFTPAMALVNVRGSTGVITNCNGAVTLSGRRVDMTNGASVWIAGDVVTVVASE